MFLTSLQKCQLQKKKKKILHMCFWYNLLSEMIFIACDNRNFLNTSDNWKQVAEKQEKSLENTCEGAHFHRQVIFNDFAKYLNYLSLTFSGKFRNIYFLKHPWVGCSLMWNNFTNNLRINFWTVNECVPWKKVSLIWTKQKVQNTYFWLSTKLNSHLFFFL